MTSDPTAFAGTRVRGLEREQPGRKEIVLRGSGQGLWSTLHTAGLCGSEAENLIPCCSPPQPKHHPRTPSQVRPRKATTAQPATRGLQSLQSTFNPDS